ncbi:MAG: hypothetical protein LBG22_05110 [Treponema sp.]|jgi:hypothetical protein|nr:hypothetical protein [Treponema sp.]
MAIQLSPRQVHLDFHTSEYIPAVASEFDAASFARTVKEAHISSITVFARCHHGWLYYPSKKFPELIHPNLADKNLLVEQVGALHEAGVRAPVYITVQWDYHTATTRPEWLIRKLDGSHEGGPFTEPGFYQSLCVNTGYYEFLKAHTEEVCELLGQELDGIFFDIVGIRPCWCASCRAEMKRLGINAADEEAVQGFAKTVLTRFKRDMTAVVRKYSKDCTIFYNAGHVGPCTRDSADAYTHFELESLPSGSWGYQHFPVTARYARKLGLDCMGMTGKFHTEWGDFHSLKNQAALEFECFRMLSYGFAASVGDQLEPRGALNPATYRLIGSVFGPFEEREPWARPAVPLTEAALFSSESPLVEHKMPEDILGAAQLLEELALQFDILDETMDLSPYRLAILPESFRPAPDFERKLESFVARGGAVIACGKALLSGDNRFPACFGAGYEGENECCPDFLIARGKLAGGLEPDNEYVIYQQGLHIKADADKTLLCARSPYFPRKGDRFCSHRYTPSAGGKPYPAAVRNGNVLYFSHPLFTQYRSNAPRWCKTLISNAIDLLLPQRLVRHDGPSTLTVSVLEQTEKERYSVHLLSYIPVRKSATIDIIEERTPVRNLSLELHLPRKLRGARLVPEGRELPLTEDKRVTIPLVDGYAVLELPFIR